MSEKLIKGVIDIKMSRQTSKGKYRYAGVNIEGLDELSKAFSDLGEDALFKLRDDTIRAAEIVQRRAREIVGNDTDISKKIIVKKPGKQGKKKRYRMVAAVALKGGKDGGQYGVPLELGHRLYFMGHKTNVHIKERPFLRPAADQSKDEVLEIIANGMNRIIKEAQG